MNFLEVIVEKEISFLPQGIKFEDKEIIIDLESTINLDYDSYKIIDGFFGQIIKELASLKREYISGIDNNKKSCVTWISKPVVATTYDDNVRVYAKFKVNFK